MKTNFLKRGYGFLMTLAFVMQLLVAPVAFGAELSGLSDTGVIVPHNECQGGTCS